MTDRVSELADLYRDRVRRELAGGLPAGAEDVRRLLERRTRDLLAADRPALSAADAERLIARVIDDSVGLGPLDALVADPAVTEVIANGPDVVYAERDGRLTRESAAFRDEAHLRQVIERIVGAAAGGWTTPARWWTPGSPTAAASTRCCPRWPSTGRC